MEGPYNIKVIKYSKSYSIQKPSVSSKSNGVLLQELFMIILALKIHEMLGQLAKE